MTENYTICNCKQVTYFDIMDVMEQNKKFSDVLEAFQSVQEVTNCSTGCGRCYQNVLDAISQIMNH